MSSIKALLKKYREFILYCIFGFGTYLIDTGLFAVLGTLLPLSETPWLMHTCSVLSTTAAILFAYFTNRRYVFQSTAHGARAVAKEMLEFFAARIFTLVVAELLLQYTVVNHGFDPRLMKFLINLLIVALNYVFSKLWIFHK